MSIYDVKLSSMILSPRELPKNLFRVEIDDTATAFKDGAFLAPSAITMTVADECPAYCARVIRDHLDWKCRNLSPFISLFDNFGHTLAWAEAYVREHQGETYNIFRIDPNSVQPTVIFCAATLVDAYKIELSNKLRSGVEQEYLATPRIPPRALRMIKEGKSWSILTGQPPIPAAPPPRPMQTPRSATLPRTTSAQIGHYSVSPPASLPPLQRRASSNSSTSNAETSNDNRNDLFDYSYQDRAVQRLVENLSATVIDELRVTPDLLSERRAVAMLVEGLKGRLEAWIRRR